jgi:hypothetical protein
MHRHQNRALAVTFVTIGATLALCGPAPLAVRQAPAASSVPRISTIEKSYGTLEFRGVVERSETADDYEFRTRLAVTFHPAEKINRVAVVQLRVMQLVATRMTATAKAEALHRDAQPIDVVLIDEGETKSLPEMVFRLPKSIAATVNHVGLGVSDGTRLWPVATELR